MYTLLIILALSGSGKSISTTTIEFDTKERCETAMGQVDKATSSSFSPYYRKTVICLRTK